MGKFQLGIDVLLNDPVLLKSLQGKKLSLVAHPASVTAGLVHSLDALMENKSLNIVSAFGPQHGMKGEKQYNMVESENYTDPVYKIPVYSLYGEVRRPTESMMKTFDVVLFDLQDVGTRIYTYLTTLLYMMEACAKYGKKIVVLDRPNPAGRPIEGALLQPGWRSFVGASEMPIRHGMTLGEAAFWLKKHHDLKLELEIVKMKNYFPEKAPGYGWPLHEIAWVNPSPNAPSLNMARCFPGMVMVEGTHLSEGRGTTKPLEMVGAPDLDMMKILGRMESMQPDWMEGAKIRPCFFQPTFYKYKDQLCQGLQIHTDDSDYQHQVFRPYRFMSLFFKALRKEYPSYQLWRKFPYEYETERMAIDVINGGPFLRTWVDDSEATTADLSAHLEPDEKAWREMVKGYWLY